MIGPRYVERCVHDPIGWATDELAKALDHPVLGFTHAVRAAARKIIEAKDLWRLYFAEAERCKAQAAELAALRGQVEALGATPDALRLAAQLVAARTERDAARAEAEEHRAHRLALREAAVASAMRHGWQPRWDVAHLGGLPRRGEADEDALCAASWCDAVAEGYLARAKEDARENNELRARLRAAGLPEGM